MDTALTLLALSLPSLCLGVTKQPWEYNGYKKFPSLYFAAQPIGDLSNSQLDKIANFELAIIEFRANQFDGEESGSGAWADGDEAGAEVRQCEALKARHPNKAPPCLVYRNGMWAGTMYKKQLDAMSSTPEAFLDSQWDCSGHTDYPLDIEGDPPRDSGIDKCLYDFRQPEANTVFQDVIDGVITESATTAGVFIDNGQAQCDIAPEDGFGDLDDAVRRDLMSGAFSVYREAFQNLADNNKYAILSTTNKFSTIDTNLVTWEDDCPLPEDDLVDALEGVPFARNNEFWMLDLGDLCTAQIRNAIIEKNREVPMVVHTPYFPDQKGCLDGCFGFNNNRVKFSENSFLEFSMAAFLVSYGPGSYFGFSNMQDPNDEYMLGGWADSSWKYYPQYDYKFGAPTSEPQEVSTGVFQRTFETGKIVVDCGTGQYSLEHEGSGSDDECKDDGEFRYKNHPKKGCKWVGRRRRKRCDKKFKGKPFWKYCPVACKTCSRR